MKQIYGKIYYNSRRLNLQSNSLFKFIKAKIIDLRFKNKKRQTVGLVHKLNLKLKETFYEQIKTTGLFI